MTSDTTTHVMPEPTRSPLPERLRRAIMSTVLLGAVAAVAGLLLTLSGGYFNPHAQFRRYFLAIGTGALFTPGVLAITGAWLMAQGRPVGTWLALGTLLWGALIAATLTALQFTVTPITPMPVLLTAAASVAAVTGAWHVWTARYLVGQRAGGFEVT